MGIDRGKTLRSAQKHLAKGQLDRAIAEYRRVLDGDPGDTRTLLKMGDLFARKGDIGPASDTYHRVAQQYADEGFFLKAVAVYNQILKLEPNQLQALERLAEMYELLSLSSDALSVYEKVVEALFRQGNVEQGLAKLGRIVQLDPANVAVRIRYAEALSQANRKDEAAEAFEAGARLLKDEGRIEDYLKVAERLMFHRPDDTELAREMARFYLDRVQPRHALAKLQLCFQANPAHVPTLEMLGRCFDLLGDKPKMLSVYGELARIHGEQGRQSERAQALRKVVELNPDAVDARRALAELSASGTPAASPTGAASGPPAVGAAAQPPSAAEQPRDRPSSEIPEEFFVDEEPPLPADEPSLLSDLIVVEDGVADESGSREVGAGPDSLPSPSVALGAFGSPGSATESQPRQPKVAPHSTQIRRLVGESEVFARYGLKEKVIANLNEVLNLDPNHIEARKRLRDLYLDVGNTMEALTQLLMLAELEKATDPSAAAGYLREVLALDPTNDLARRELEALEPGAATSSALEQSAAPGSAEPTPADGGEVVFFEEPEEDGTTEQIGVSDVLTLDSGLIEPADMFDRAGANGADKAGVSRALPGASGWPEPEESNPVEPVPMTAGVVPVRPEPTALEPEQEDTAADVAADSVPMAAEAAPVFEEPMAGAAEAAVPLEESAPAEPTREDKSQKQDGLPPDVAWERLPAEQEQGEPPEEMAEVLEEADFYVAQGMTDEARDTLQEAMSSWPEHPILMARLRALDSADAEEPRSRTISLAPGPDDEEQPDPTQSHYDLGVAYMEMELHDQAVEEFKLCLGSPGLVCGARTMIGLCRVATGKIQEGAEDFRRGLEEPNRTESEEMELLFQLGNAYELLDMRGEALECFQKVADRDPDFRDVKNRMQRASLPPEPAQKDEIDEFDELFDDMIVKD